MGEAGYIHAMLGFIIGMAGWMYILYEIFSGEAGKIAAKSATSLSNSLGRYENDRYDRLGNLSIRLRVWLPS